MDEFDDCDDLYADLTEQVNVGITTVNSNSESIAKESQSNSCELNNRSDSLVDDAGAVLDLDDGIQSNDYTSESDSESEDDLCIVLNDTERSGSTKGEIGRKEEDFRVGDVLQEHERCEHVGFKGNFSTLRYGQGDWDHFRVPNSGGLTDAVKNGFSSFLPRNWNIFCVNIEELDYKPWRKAGANTSDFFNFDFDEDSWKNYCQDLNLLWAKAMMSNWVRRDRSAFIEKGTSKVSDKPKGKAILVRSGFGERVPSTDIWRPCTERDSNVLIHINTTDSMENENNVNTIEAKNPETEEGDYESALMEHENETMERFFSLQKGDTYCGVDDDFIQYSSDEKEGRGSQSANMDTDSCSEESVEECNFNRVHSSSNKKSEFQSSRCSSSRTGTDKISEVLEKDRNDKNRGSIEAFHESYASVSVGYRNNWSTMKHRNLRYKSRILSFKEEQSDRLFARQGALRVAPWRGKGDRYLLGFQRDQYMDVQDPRNPRSQIRDCYGGSPTGNVKYKMGVYGRHLQGRRRHFKQITLCKGHIPSQKGHYRKNLICGHSYTDDKFVRDTSKERYDERQYNGPVNSRLNCFHEGFVERGSCNGVSRSVPIKKSFLNGRRGYNNDWLDESNNGMYTSVDLTERSYIAENWEERDGDLLALRHKVVVNARYGGDRKKLSRKGNNIAGEEYSQHIKRANNCTSDGQDRHPKISRFEKNGPYRAGQVNTISRVDRYDKQSAKALVTDESGEKEEMCSERILEAMEKMQKRRERFKESAFPKKEGEVWEEKALRQVEADPIVDEAKPLIPVRKRRWGCQ